jgi:hypothetical protein
MSEFDRYKDPYRYERKQIPPNIFQEPAVYWLGQLAAGTAPSQLTHIPYEDKRLLVAVRPRRNEVDDIRATVLTIEEDENALYTAMLTTHVGVRGNDAGTGCAHDRCKRFEIFEAAGRLNDVHVKHDDINHTYPLDVYNANGADMRADVAAILRETALGADGSADAATDAAAYQSFIDFTKGHNIAKGLVAVVTAAHRAG